MTDSYPKVRVVQGDNDSSDLLKEEASKADIVIRKHIYPFLLFLPESFFMGRLMVEMIG